MIERYRATDNVNTSLRRKPAATNAERQRSFKARRKAEKEAAATAASASLPTPITIIGAVTDRPASYARCTTSDRARRYVET